MRFERRPEKNPCGDKILEIWIGTKAQAPSNEKPLIQRLYKKEIRTADPTRVDAWYLEKKELNKVKLNERKNEVGSEA